MTSVVLIKTGALGDVLRTTAILPGLARRYPGLELTWVTAPSARSLVESHPDVARVVASDPTRSDFVERTLDALLGCVPERVLSFDDERLTCRLATALASGNAILSGAYEDGVGGALRYTPDVAPWFDMGLLSTHGIASADAAKRANELSHPRIFADMLGIEFGRPSLVLDPASVDWAARSWRELGMEGSRWVGLNTGAGGRWASKRLSVERTVELARGVAHASDGDVGFLLLGGPSETERNLEIGERLGSSVRWTSAGSDLALLEFAALVDRLDVLVSSDSLALHVAVARDVPVVCFFAPTSAAEIELYGRGTKVASTARDACSYRADADTSTLTVERLAPPVLDWLARGR